MIGNLPAMETRLRKNGYFEAIFTPPYCEESATITLLGSPVTHMARRNVKTLPVKNFLGVPFNIASYALMSHMIAQQVGLEAGDFVWTGGDVHLYSNHFEQAREQLSRTPRALPKLKLNKAPDLFSYRFEDVEIVGYDPLPHIKAPVAV